MSEMDKIKDLVEKAIKSEDRPTFIETRYPYTYSADFLRTHEDIIPKKYLEAQGYVGDFMLSRGQAAAIKTQWAEDLGVFGYDLACVFADGYLKENHYEDWKPPTN